MLTITATELNRFMACNGNRLLGGILPPDTDTTSRDEGNAAHHMAMTVIRGQSTIEELVDRKAPNGVYMTDDMAEYVQLFLDGINRAYTSPLHCEVETSFSDHTNYNIPARADIVGVSAYRLHIDDFKYGWRIVEPQRNWTLIAHAIGFCQQHDFQPQEIEFTVHQPRPYHADGPARSWVITYSELTELHRELHATLCNPSDVLRTSEHCAKCHALPSCPAARKAEMNAIDATDMAFDDAISNELLAFNLDTLERASAMIKARHEAFEELAKYRIKAGAVVDNYAVEPRLGNTAWNKGISVSTLRMLTGKELGKEKLVSPAEAKRLGVNETTIKALTNRPNIGIKLTRVNANKRAERIFGKGNNT